MGICSRYTSARKPWFCWKARASWVKFLSSGQLWNGIPENFHEKMVGQWWKMVGKWWTNGEILWNLLRWVLFRWNDHPSSGWRQATWGDFGGVGRSSFNDLRPVRNGISMIFLKMFPPTLRQVELDFSVVLEGCYYLYHQSIIRHFWTVWLMMADIDNGTIGMMIPSANQLSNWDDDPGRLLMMITDVRWPSPLSNHPS